MDGKINDEIYTWGQSMRGEGNRKWENSVENWKMEKKNKKSGFAKGRKIKRPGKVRKNKIKSLYCVPGVSSLTLTVLLLQVGIFIFPPDDAKTWQQADFGNDGCVCYRVWDMLS